MSEEIIKVFDYIGEKLGIAIDYTQENVMPYLEDLWHRYITYEIINKVLGIIIGLIIMTVGIKILLKFFNSYKLSLKDELDGVFYCKDLYGKSMTTGGILILTIGIALSIASVIMIICNISYIIELVFLPEKYVLEAINIMMQKGC